MTIRTLSRAAHQLTTQMTAEGWIVKFRMNRNVSLWKFEKKINGVWYKYIDMDIQRAIRKALDGEAALLRSTPEPTPDPPSPALQEPATAL